MTATRRYRMVCPHCGSPAYVRTSEAMSNLTRQSTYYCANVECGHTFMAQTEIVYTISPSATPNPAVHLPISKHVRRDLLRQQLDRAPQADYCPRNTLAHTPDLFGS